MTGVSLSDALQIAAFIIAVVAAIIAAIAYWSDVRHRRTDWLFQLFYKFYEQKTYSNIRKILDYRLEPEFSQLQQQLETNDGPKDLAEGFSAYLNFFEFILNLERTRRMKRYDIENMFAYYLTSLAEIGWVSDYVANPQHGFEALAAECKRRAVKSA